MLGAVPAATRFHQVAVHVWERQASDADVERHRRHELGTRCGRTAELGTGMITNTTAAAADGGPTPV